MEARLKKGFELALLALVVMAPLVVFPASSDPFWGAEKGYFSIGAAAALLFGAAWLLKSKNFNLPKTPYDMLFGIFIIFNLLGAAKAENYPAFISRVALNLLYFSLFYAGCVYLANFKNGIKKIIDAVIFSSLLMAIYGLLQAAGFNSDTFGDRPGSTLGNPDFSAGHLLLALPLAFYGFINAQKKTAKAYYFTASITLTLYLLMAQVRGAYIGFAALAALFIAGQALLNREETKKKIKSFIALAAGFVIIAALFFALSPSAVQRMASTINPKTTPKTAGEAAAFAGREQAVAIRMYIWKNTLNLIKDNLLLGSGAGNFKVKYSYYQASSLPVELVREQPYRRTEHAHNDYLQFAAEYGVPAACVMIIFFAMTLINAFKFAEKNRQKAGWPIAVASGFGGLFVHALFNFPFLIIPTAATFYALSAAALNLQGQATTRKTKPAGAKTILAALATFALILSVTGALNLASGAYMRKAYEYGARSMNELKANEKEFYFEWYDTQINYAADAIHLAPFNEDNYVELGKMFARAGENDRANFNYMRAYKINPGKWEAAIGAFDYYVSKQQAPEALEAARRLYRMSPHAEQVILKLGFAYYLNSMFDDAIKLYEAEQGNASQRHVMLSQMAALYGQKGDLQKAVLYATEAVKAKPDYTEPYYYLAVSYYKMKNYNAAEKELKKILSISPGDTSAKQLLKVIQDER